MKASRLPLFFFVALSGCDTNVTIDPEGYRCDALNPCPSGYSCVAGACRRGVVVDPSCDGVTCDAPPAPTCTSGASLRTFNGRCVSGQCQYEPLDMTCANACAAGACVDACAGVTCNDAPDAVCADAATLRTFAMTGACAGGACSYAPTDVACPNGCENGVCKGVDLCVAMNVTCAMAPPPTCMGATRRVYSAGTCAPGTGQCSYTQVDTPCPNGCALGTCLMASLSFSQTGPRVRFAINGIDVAPGSSGNSALAVGNGGKLARWDGTQWSELTTPSTADLRAVTFVTGTVAWAVGASGTAYSVRASTGAVQAQSLPSSSMANLRFVSGRGEGELLVTDAVGGWWRFRGNAWSSGALPMANAPWVVRGAHLDESLRERVVGSCAAGASRHRCVAYRFLGGSTTTFATNNQAGGPFTAVGGSFEVPTNISSEAALGLGDDTLGTHTNLGVLGTINASPVMAGEGVVGITAQAVNTGRDVYVLTSSADPMSGGNGRGRLYRLARNVLSQVSTTEALVTYFGEETLSANDANGVLVAEVRRADKVNNIFRRGPITNEALDVGEDFVGASLDGTGALVLASRYGDVVVRAGASRTFEFRRAGGDWAIRGLEARNGTGTLLVGQSATTGEGVIVRNVGPVFTTLATRAGAVFNAVCRVSDTEGWAVGTGGVIYRVTSSMAASVMSPTTRDLTAVDCAAGAAVAVGADGTVLRLVNGAWEPVTPAYPDTQRLTTVQLVAGGAFVAGNGAFARFSTTSGWEPLTPPPGLTRLIARGPQELYGAFVNGPMSSVHRFDGALWSPGLVSVTGALGGGVQAGSRVVWGGTLGAIVEGG